MGLTNSSVGIRAADRGPAIQKPSPDDRVIALAGNKRGEKHGVQRPDRP